MTTSHEYVSAGTYTVTLTVTDNDGDTDIATVTITVTASASPPSDESDTNAGAGGGGCFIATTAAYGALFADIKRIYIQFSKNKQKLNF